MYNLCSVSTLVCLHHASAGNPVPSTWFAAIKAGNYNTFPAGLIHRNAMKHCPSSDATIKGHLKQTHQGLRSTKPKPMSSSDRFALLSTPDTPPTEEPSVDSSCKPTKLPPTNKLYIADFSLAKLYDTRRLPIWACSSNQYITIAFHSQCNATLCASYANKSDKHWLATYNSIMRRLSYRGHNVNLQILHN
jgi:hypothetical protein